MQLPSLTYLTAAAKSTLTRFPLSIASAFLTAILGILLIETNDRVPETLPLVNLLLCSALGIVWFFAVTMFIEKRNITGRDRIVLYVMAVSLLAGLYFTFPGKESVSQISIPYIRYGLYNVTIHLLVAFSPFLGVGQINGFWNYNKTLFLRFLGSLLFSAALFAGLAIALGSLDFLFDVDVHSKLFGELWVSIATVFQTWFFLSGIPRDLDQLEEVHEYPKGLKIFSQYILLPLLILYLIILYCYSAKIVFTGEWPKGVVPYLVSSVAVLGILTLMLLHPYGKQANNTWIGKFSRIYYFILFPLVLLLFIALVKRSDDYGVTINRYALFALGIWLTVTCCYFAVGKKNIKFVPLSLAITLVVISFGPWGMFSLSERSQVNRLQEILTTSKLMDDGRIANETQLPDSAQKIITNKGANDGLLSDSLKAEVTSILSYLDDHHGFNSVRSWFKQDLKSMAITYKSQFANDTLYAHRRVDEEDMFQYALGLKAVEYYELPSLNGASDIESLSFAAVETPGPFYAVSGYEYFTTFSHYSYQNWNQAIHAIDSTKGSADYNFSEVEEVAPPASLSLKLREFGTHTAGFTFQGDSIYFNLDSLCNALRKDTLNKEQLPSNRMIVYGSHPNWNFRVELKSLNLEMRHDSIRIRNMQGNLLLRRR